MDWNQLIHEFKASGLSQAAFCRRRNIAYGRFNRKLLDFDRSGVAEKSLSPRPAAAAQESRYVSIVGESPSSPLIEVATRDGLRLRVPLPHLERVLVVPRQDEVC